MKVFIFLMLSLISFKIYALTLEEAVNLALKNNPQIQIYEKNTQISKLNLKIDRQLFLPQFFIQYSHTWLSQTPYLNIPPNPPLPPISFKQMEKSFNNFEFGFNYLFYAGGKRHAKLKIDKIDIKASFEKLSEQKKQIVTKVKKAYVQTLKAKAIIKIYEKQLEAVRAHYQTVKGFYEEGYVSYVELLQARVKISETKKNLKSAKESFSLSKAYLLTVLGQSPYEDVKLENIDITPKITFNLRFLQKKALKNRNILRFAQYQKKKLKQLEKIEKADFLPQLFSQGKLIYTDQIDYLDPKANFSLTLGIKLSVQGVQPYYKMLKTKLEEKKAELQIKDLKNKILLQVQNAYQKFITAKENLLVSKIMLNQAEEYYKLVVEQYKNQLATTTDVLNAQAQLTTARQGKEISYYQLLEAIFELENATGTKLIGGI
ncbi:MAG: TolC family protein [Aquificae bacterium]|nr:TolC family protein [Aquificota bacterium]